eukprot:TRINITY_DN3473_c0_g1_i1.p1 TRINITY_DN3473_c0_g1~~TRINITY_DN3473_c0_g1_i1.p1  ORF type:complete len:330 (+),score=64.91 TRINITY_DN3473_c0_g1_i1:30-992(+)
MNGTAARRLAMVREQIAPSSTASAVVNSSTGPRDVHIGTQSAAGHTAGKTQPSVGFVGGGQMATALATGIITSGFSSVDKVIAGDVYEASRKAFTDKTGAKAVSSNEEVVKGSDIIIIAVKPQVMKAVLKEIRPMLNADKLLISIVAGFTIQSILEGLGNGAELRVIRVMPNTPALIGKAASAFSLGGKASAEDAKQVEQLLKGIGIAAQVPDHLLDAVTGMSGSGPAYVYQFIEALSDGGVRVGLPRDVATRFAAQTVLGAAQMVLETGEHPGSLKDKVTSPGGTTIAGLHAMEKGGVRGAIMDTVQAATNRSIELGRL